MANSDPGSAEVALVGLGNEIDLAAHDGWAMVAPYGDWEHAQGLQRFGRQQADEIVSHYRSIWARIKRAVVGLPIYKGHPDHPAFANTHTDKTEYGQIADLEAREDGLWMKPVLSSGGADLVLGGLKFVSPNWRARQVGLANGRPLFLPAILDSVGLTDRPNIPGPSLANSAADPAANAHPAADAATTTETQNMPQWLLTLLGLTNETSEETVRTKLTELLARPEPSALANETTARTSAETRVAELTTANTELTTRLANERGERITLLVDAAVRDGRITEATRATWSARLTRDFDAEATALANERAAVKTGAVTSGLGARKAEAGASTRERIVALVNERLADPKLAHLSEPARYDAAYHAVKASHPDLFKPQQQQASA